jgi:dipeptidyl aminopeptidase/acylaminoacyl peptidase/CubicO group peptidase (beta-lactamase class C family)
MTPQSLVLEDLARIVVPTDTAISPDGRRVVFVRSEFIDELPVTSLWSVAEGVEPRRLTNGPADLAPRISPDGSRVAFLRAVDGIPQLHLMPLDGGEPEALTRSADCALGAGAAEWSPEGDRIAFSAPVDRASSTERDAPFVTDHLGYKADGTGWLGEVRLQLSVVDVASGAVRRLTDGDWHVGGLAWSPDGLQLAFMANIEPDSDLTLASSAYSIVVDDPFIPPRRLGAAASVGGPLFWLPDGESVVAVGTAVTRAGNADLLRLRPAEGGDAPQDVALTADIDRNVMPGAPGYPGGRPALASDNAEVVFCLRDRGWTHLYGVGTDGGPVRAIVAEANTVVSALSVATRARVASVIVATGASFGEVATVDLDSGRVTVLTAITAQSLPGVELFEAEEREFGISDGGVVHGWLLSSPRTTGAAPLLLDIHGGPHNSWSGVADNVHLYHQALAAMGWRILTLNPRGSDGYGEEFMRAVVGGWGTADAADFHEPVDALIAEGLADADRLAVTGYSYGGYSTAQLTSHSTRFAAAVAGGLICDFGAMAGNSDLGGFLADLALGLSPVGGAEQLVAASPIASVDNVVTPTLILHGAADERCPVGQAEAWFSALRIQDVPARLVAYPGGSHLFFVTGSFSHRLDYNRRVVDWLQRYTSGPAGRKPARGTATAALGAPRWQHELDVLRERYGVTGAQFGIVELDGDGRQLSRSTVGSGVLNAATGASVDVDALFQIGSITKVWTTMLVMQLVDEGLLDLDARVVSILPDFAVADDATTAGVTVRSLLDHRSGIDGDLFIDTGRGDDCIERYVAALADAGQVHALDDGFSYCNSGFVVAGRIVEVLRGASWDAVLKQRIIDPAGLSHTVTLLEDVPRFAAATGHGPDSSPVSVWPITRSMGPAGLISASIGDLLTFGTIGLRGGETLDGTRIVSAASAAAMRERQVDLSDVQAVTSGWGLGWFLETWSGSPVFGHDGGTYGQRAYLRIFPEQGFVLGLLTTGGRPDGLYRDLLTSAATAIAGLSAPVSLLPLEQSALTDRDPGLDDAVLGHYGAGGMAAEVRRGEDSLEIVMIDRSGAPEVEPQDGEETPAGTALALLPATEPGYWVARSPGSAGWSQVKPHRDGLYVGLRFLPREDTA